MRNGILLPLVAIMLAAAGTARVCADAADAIAEVANESKAAVRFTVLRRGSQPREYFLNPRSQTQIATTDDAVLDLAGGRIALAAETRYAFRENAKGQVTLVTLGKRAAAKPQQRPAPKQTPRPATPPQGSANSSLPPATPITPGVSPLLPAPTAPAPTAPARTTPNVPSVGGDLTPAIPDSAPRQAARVATIAVKVCVDDEEAARDEIWKKRLGDRLAAASAITEKTAGVRFHAVEFVRWDTDDAQHDFARSLREFETEVDGGNARLVIGFCSQYEIPKSEVHLGGTRGPLHSHILIREWSRHISEPERLEVLTHEIGHYLGAVHSGDSASVMRPKLGDRRSRAAKFEIRFDDANSQIVRLLGDEMRLRPVRRLADLSDRTKAEMLKRYDALAKANPKDPAVKRHIELVEQAGGKR
jgi:hypothetical protein